MFKRIAHGWQQRSKTLRPLYEALEPIVIFAVVVAAIILQLLIPERIVSNARYVLPIVEGAVLVALVVVVELQRRGVFAQNVARKVSILLTLLMATAAAYALFHILDDLLGGQVRDGKALVFAGMKIWGTFIIVFALVYWELDRGGQHGRRQKRSGPVHLRFPQDETPRAMGREWSPTFSDYLYLSVTNSTAFSPTDTMPLTHSAKLFMGTQALLSLATLGIVAARAVNIL
jgi:hypothetical protein